MRTSRSTLSLQLAPLLLVVGAHTALSQNSPPAGKLISRQAIVSDPMSHKVYAVDPDADSLWIFDPRAHSQKKLSVGKGPIAVDLNAATGRVYVLNHENGTVSVVDEKTDAVLATVSVGARPYVLAVDPGTNKVFVSNIFSDEVTVIDGRSNATTQQKLGSADAMAANPKTGKLYLLGYESSSLTVLNGGDGSTSKAAAGAIHLWGLAVDASRNTVYVTRIGSNDLAAIDEANHTFKVVSTGALPAAVAVNPLTNRVYVANYGGDSVTVIDGSKLVAIATVHVGKQPQAITVDAKTGSVYVANTHGDSVSVIDGLSNAIVATMPAGKNPYALSLGSEELFVANEGAHAFTRIDISHVKPPTK